MTETPRFILHKNKLLERYEQIKKLADQVSYSLKTNYEAGNVLKEETNCMFSVHSIHSVDLIGNPDRIWFFAQGWDENIIEKSGKVSEIL